MPDMPDMLWATAEPPAKTRAIPITRRNLLEAIRDFLSSVKFYTDNVAVTGARDSAA
jgi:hypothetical protein